jgi:hypothetical protein
MLRFFGIHTDARAWRRGAEGEEEVARRLSALGDRWRVLHGIPIGEGGTDIDHLVIGPAGVFTINTKNHLGKKVTVYERAIYVSGTKQPYYPKARAEGKKAATLLSSAVGSPVTVLPLIVVMASELNIKGMPFDIRVVGRKRIAQWLSGQSSCVTRERVEEIYAAARRPSTWSSRR